MCVEKDKIDEVKKKIRDSIKDSDMVIEDEPQSSGDPGKMFEQDKEDKENSDDEQA
jgi:hypothetical protein